MNKVPAAKVATAIEDPESPLPPKVQEALGELVGAAKEGLKAKRHGHEGGSVTLGGRRTKVRRPSMRTADDTQELPLRTYEHFADRDPLTRAGLGGAPGSSGAVGGFKLPPHCGRAWTRP
jgi:hypothetical protein